MESRGGCLASHTLTAVPGAVGLKREPCLLHAPRPEMPQRRQVPASEAVREQTVGVGGVLGAQSCVGWVVREGPELKGRKLASDVKGLDG